MMPRLWYKRKLVQPYGRDLEKETPAGKWKVAGQIQPLQDCTVISYAACPRLKLHSWFSKLQAKWNNYMIQGSQCSWSPNCQQKLYRMERSGTRSLTVVKERNHTQEYGAKEICPSDMRERGCSVKQKRRESANSKVCLTRVAKESPSNSYRDTNK